MGYWQPLGLEGLNTGLQLAGQAASSSNELSNLGVGAGLGVGESVGTAAITGSSTLGAAALSGLETAGIGAAVAGITYVASDLISCGTLTQVGCSKRSQATMTEEVEKGILQYSYLLEQGHITVAQYNDLVNTVWQGFQNGSKSIGRDPEGYFAGTGATFKGLGYACSYRNELNIPYTALTSQYYCEGARQTPGHPNFTNYKGPSQPLNSVKAQVQYALQFPSFLATYQKSSNGSTGSTLSKSSTHSDQSSPLGGLTDTQDIGAILVLGGIAFLGIIIFRA